MSLLVEIVSGRSLADNVELQLSAAQSATSSLLTGMALIISAIIQQHTYGLSVFHALIVLNLCWIIVIGGYSPYHIVAVDNNEANEGFIEKSMNLMFVVFVLKLMLMGGFGVWVIRDVLTFDSSPDACTSSTVLYILGHYPRVTSESFRRPMLALYSMLLVPVWNIIMPIILLFIVCIPMILPVFIVTYIDQASQSWAGRYQPVVYTPGQRYVTAALSWSLININIIVSTEKTIQANVVDSEEQQWGLGQTFAVFVALIPIGGIYKQIVSPRRRRRQRNEETASISTV